MELPQNFALGRAYRGKRLWVLVVVVADVTGHTQKE